METPEVSEQVDVCIVGAGIAGLTALWRLQRAGFTGSVAWLDLGDVAGGTSRGDSSPHGKHPLGAHYITVPGTSAVHVRALLTELGVLVDRGPGEPPEVVRTNLCFAPQERIFLRGRWVEGLWPVDLADGDDEEQRTRFAELAEALTHRRGSDGRLAFDLPVAKSSQDPELRALAQISFASWLDQEGLTSPRLRWWLEYGTRDDFGTTLATTSAWAGLHYHCCRRPSVRGASELGTEVLTWPGGNSWLVEQLSKRLPHEPRLQCVVRKVDAESGEVWFEQDGAVKGLQAQRVVLAVPSGVASRLTGLDRGEVPDAAPWVVASLQVDALPQSRGLETAWDSVIYSSASLGYVTNSHQTASYGGPSVLTWYRPFVQAEVGDARRAAAALTWEGLAEEVLADLLPAHPDLRRRLQRLDGWIWGHGTVRPLVGLHAVGALDALAAVHGRVHFAHTDLSGMSLFEEASWHGVRAAEEVLTALELDVGDSLL